MGRGGDGGEEDIGYVGIGRLGGTVCGGWRVWHKVCIYMIVFVFY